MFKQILKVKYVILHVICKSLLSLNTNYNQPLLIKIHPLVFSLISKSNEKPTNKEIKILDTSKGDIIDYKKILSELHRLKCTECGFLYEGRGLIAKCPVCGSEKLDDSYDEMYT